MAQKQYKLLDMSSLASNEYAPEANTQLDLSSLQQEQGSWGSLSTAQKAGAVNMGVQTALGALGGDSTDTTTGVASGVASGAATGAMFGGVGAAVGGAIGGIAGGLSASAKRKEQARKAKADMYKAKANIELQRGQQQGAALSSLAANLSRTLV